MRHRGGVRAAAAQRGDVALLVHALEAGDHRDVLLLERARRSARASMLLMRALEKVLSVTIRHWWPRKLRGLAPLRLDGQRDQADGDLLAGGDHHVLLALVGPVGDLRDELEQAVRLAGHRGDDDHHVVALPSGRRCSGARRS